MKCGLMLWCSRLSPSLNFDPPCLHLLLGSLSSRHNGCPHRACCGRRGLPVSHRAVNIAEEVCSARLIISWESWRSCTGDGRVRKEREDKRGSEKWEQKRKSKVNSGERLHKEQQHDGGGGEEQ